MVTITFAQPDAGLAIPNDQELEILLAKVVAAHPWLLEGGAAALTASDLGLAFVALGGFYRRATTDRTRYFYHWIALAQERVGERLNPTAFLAACILDGVGWQRQEPAAGALLELALDPYHGGLSDNVWQEVLRGAPVPEPVPPRQAPGYPPRGASTVSVASHFRT
jgi:hypothetical protein